MKSHKNNNTVMKLLYILYILHAQNIFIHLELFVIIVVNNPPTLNPDGGDDRTLYVTEGSNIYLTCTRDSNNAPGDLYHWIHPNGQMTPGAPTDHDSPVQVYL